MEGRGGGPPGEQEPAGGGGDGSSAAPAFVVSIVCLDYYLAKPKPGLDTCISPVTGESIQQVPTIRVFGTTPAGQGACVHVHKVFPYLYVPFSRGLRRHVRGTADQAAFLRRFSLSVDNAVRVVKDTQLSSRGKQAGGARSGYVHCCSFVRATPFYGYHACDSMFVKVYVYDPREVGRIASVLQSGAVMGTPLQPFESHIPYLLKFKTDYNLHGMDCMHAARVAVRLPVGRPADILAGWRGGEGAGGGGVGMRTLDGSQRRRSFGVTPEGEVRYPAWSENNLPEHWSRPGSSETGAWQSPSRDTRCELEADALADDIENRSWLRFDPLDSARTDRRKVVPSLQPIWQEERRRAARDEALVAALAPQPLEPRQPELLARTVRARNLAMLSRLARDCTEVGGGGVVEGTRAANAHHSLAEAESSSANSRALDSGMGDVDLNRLSQISSQLATTQDVDDSLFDLLHWMREGGGEEEEQGRREAGEQEVHAYLAQSQQEQERECQDIINCSVEIEADRASVSGEDSEEQSGRASPGAAESDSGQGGEPLNLELKLSADQRSPEGSSLGQPAIPDSFAAARAPFLSSGDHEGMHDSQVLSTQGGHGSSAEGMEPLLLSEECRSEHICVLVCRSRPPDAVHVMQTMDPGTVVNALHPDTLDRMGMGHAFTRHLLVDGSGPRGRKILIDLPPFTGGVGHFARTQGTHGKTLHVLSTAKLPPSRERVARWLGLSGHARTKKRPLAAEEQSPTRTNGGLMQLDMTACSPADCGDIEDGFFTPAQGSPPFAPASPKYDEAQWQQSKAHPAGLAAQKARGDWTPGSFAKAGAWKAGGSSQITPPSLLKNSASTPSSQAGCKVLPLDGNRGLRSQPSVMAVEVFAESRGKLLPNPKHDGVRAISLVLQDGGGGAPEASTLVLGGQADLRSAWPEACGLVSVHADEADLIEACACAILRADPDVLMGFEVQNSSLGYLQDRTEALGRSSFLRMISRSPTTPSHSETGDDSYGQLHSSGLHTAGRVIVNLWRVLRLEVKLSRYSFHHCVFSVLTRRVPRFEPRVLTALWAVPNSRWRPALYIARRALLDLEMLASLDLVSRTCELARVYGIDFFSVLTRGSQYRVESLLIRLAHSQNYVLVSPSRDQVANQPAMECLPLVMEPESTLYLSPVLVLDFQSLYPSMVIAYNLCYSTLVGHALNDKMNDRLGILQGWHPPPDLLCGALSPEALFHSPNGSLFVPKEARVGVLPRMLEEILETRQMLKGVMKRTGVGRKSLRRLLDARQFALKLLANVTYGYTAAGFSGRMPCAELADAIVQSGRETLERAIDLVEGNKEWQAKVVYGDTDSLFVHLPGRTREQAFRVGREIAARVTAANPPPVALKFEKVYHPCMLLTKKRYVGYAYESEAQAKPAFDAKGIETVRRDSCPAVAKLLERSLRVVFETRDLSLVRRYLVKQWSRILRGRAGTQDFVFAKEVRLGSYSSAAPVVPPAAIVAAKRMALDPRAEPRHAERVQYVVVHGEPGARLVDMVVSPEEMVARPGLRLHGVYYITKQINPALDRCFSLIGCDVASWFRDMPKPKRWQPTKRPMGLLGMGRLAADGAMGQAPTTIDRFYLSRHCPVCNSVSRASEPVCDSCACDPQKAATTLELVSSLLGKRLDRAQHVCNHCGGGGGAGGVVCVSSDCGMYYYRERLKEEYATAQAQAASACKVFSRM